MGEKLTGTAGAKAMAGAKAADAEVAAANANVAVREARGGAKGAGSKGADAVSRTRSVAFVGLTIAIMGVSAWVAIPFGPVLLTLQMFALMFAIMVLAPKQCMAAIAGYLVLGAVGLPMFSGMRGGIGMLAGPTGGYLWGYLLGAVVALFVREALGRAMGGAKGLGGTKAFAVDMTTCLAFIVVTYVCGCFQYAVVMGVDMAASFAVTIAPFAVPDVLKAVAAVACARAVKSALPGR